MSVSICGSQASYLNLELVQSSNHTLTYGHTQYQCTLVPPVAIITDTWTCVTDGPHISSWHSDHNTCTYTQTVESLTLNSSLRWSWMRRQGRLCRSHVGHDQTNVQTTPCLQMTGPFHPFICLFSHACSSPDPLDLSLSPSLVLPISIPY